MPICGVDVRLPFGLKPYSCQKLMMVRIITSLTKKLNLLAESPTGSGKTIALLASSCAWLDDYKRKRQELKKVCPVHGDSSDIATSSAACNEVDNDAIKLEIEETKEIYPNDTSLSCKKTRIYYGTRTHRQIGQVVKEFSRLPYAGIISHTILASREQSCINRAAKGSRDVSAYCKELISSGGLGCKFKEAMKPRYEKPRNLRNLLEQMDAVCFDIEELVDCLSSMQNPICPYFSSTRLLTQDADIIFCPFNYLIDPIIRNSSDVHLRNSIVILDEAHNIEDNCRESASFMFFEKEISDALLNVRENEDLTLKMVEKYAKVTTLVEGHEKEMTNMTIANCNEELEHVTMVSFLAGLLLRYGSFFQSALQRISSNYEEGREVQSNKINSAAIICVEKMNVTCEKTHLFDESSSSNVEGGRIELSDPLNANRYKLLEEENNVWLTSQMPNSKKSIKSGYNTYISLWCMSPELAFTSAFNDCRSVILASGTLCPVETLKTELGFKFHSQMEGDQIIPKDQIFASVLPMGPSGHKLCATYRNVSCGNNQFISELALNVYTPSNPISEDGNTRWTQVVVKEPRRSADLLLVLEQYESAVKNPAVHGQDIDGALLLAVFRGKVRHYEITKSLLTGEQWYVSQAYRAINQALGRYLSISVEISHYIGIQDSNATSSGRISRWIQQQLIVYTCFRNFETSLTDFVRRMQFNDERKKCDSSQIDV
ncbi:DEAD2 domain protein [Dictyocaulus viviparus]|uniref:DEAD2 domain protein n=1 Tax=Dictyocaulus viviparus TaxID=29172 RepID=A0A0D8Y1E9_DICVI|nr:DEAD2 domain protein [Dictyocaulus viviparus]